MCSKLLTLQGRSRSISMLQKNKPCRSSVEWHRRWNYGGGTFHKTLLSTPMSNSNCGRCGLEFWNFNEKYSYGYGKDSNSQMSCQLRYINQLTLWGCPSHLLRSTIWLISHIYLYSLRHSHSPEAKKPIGQDIFQVDLVTFVTRSRGSRNLTRLIGELFLAKFLGRNLGILVFGDSVK